jgi:cytochrome c peroxidase
MKKIYLLTAIVVLVVIFTASFRKSSNKALYSSAYFERLSQFNQQQQELLAAIENNNVHTDQGLEKIRIQINQVRNCLKGMDFWFRYLEPTMYKQINGPLPVEWETEVFEKFEKPYKRPGAGLTLAALYTEEKTVEKDSLLHLIQASVKATETYGADSITKNLKTYHHFYLCNRLFLLNLAAIYTTGFECPDTDRIIPELRVLMNATADIYTSFNESFPATQVNDVYLSLYRKAIEFVNTQPDDFSKFDHFSFIRNFVNPLFGLNQQAISDYKVISRSFVDYSLNKKDRSIFDKQLYNGQNAKGIYLRVDDEQALEEIDKIGKLLFYDPILSGNNKRSCASCHKPTEYFTDTAMATATEFEQKNNLPRNTPSLINVVYNHLVMLDGKHISLQNQTKEVMTNPLEMGSKEQEILQKVLSCPDYKKAFEKLLQYTPTETAITLEHITSAITLYYSRFSNFYAPFDEAMNSDKDVSGDVKAGFNLFMSKAQCATCHFVPQFNGVKPPYVGSEFEVLGVPEDTTYKQLSTDKGRYNVNPAEETLHAFRTGSLRNSAYTAPYMHNGVFKTMDEVIDFYDAGGGTGKGLTVSNQTLSADSLHLTVTEKHQLTQFLHSLNENIQFEAAPEKLPRSKSNALNTRKPGGEY